VSAEHARLRRRNGRWFVEDLNSTNGTLLNQRPVEREQPVEYGDMLSIGDVRLKLAR
jgi:pSer/pThr/pTyr-binding forkhead associated (FHA) protein